MSDITNQVQLPEMSFDPIRVFGPDKIRQPGSFRQMTAPFRMLPAVIIAGVQKGGTSSLYSYLGRHPEVIRAKQKEIYFFNNIVHYSLGLNWYKSFFALGFYRKMYQRRKRIGKAITLEATANYFEFPESATRVIQTLPHAKVIILLRNPADRAFSQYQMSAKLGFEKLSFEKALEEENKRIEFGKEFRHNYAYQRLGYRTKGIYAPLMKEWMKAIPEKQLLVVKSEDLFQNPGEVYPSILQFIGINTNHKPEFDIINAGPGKHMKPETRNELMAFYEPHNRELYALCGRDFKWT